MKLFKTEDWHENMGDCLFFHFPSFDEPPEVYCGTPLDSNFVPSLATHFVQIDFNSIMEQAQDMCS